MNSRLITVLLFGLLSVVGSGSVAIGDFVVAPNRGLVDFSSSASRIPGTVWRNLDQLEAYIQRNGGVLIRNADSILDSLGKGKSAAFTVRQGVPGILLRSNPTKREVLHEVGHLLTHRHLGADAYNALSKDKKKGR